MSVATIALVTACGSDSTTGPSSSSSSPVGSYTMSTVNGKSLPAPLAADGSYSWDVTAGTMKLMNDGKFSVVTNYRQTLPGSISNFVDSTGGTWTQTGSALQFIGSDGTTGTATFDKTSLTLTTTDAGDALTFVYGNKK